MKRMPDTEREYVFSQRDELIALLSTKYPSHLCRDEDGSAEWNDIVCIHLPSGQAQFHVGPMAVRLFAHLTYTANDWDGSGPKDRSKRLCEAKHESLRNS